MLRHVRSGKWTWPPGNELCGRRFGTGLQSHESFTSKRRSNMNDRSMFVAKRWQLCISVFVLYVIYAAKMFPMEWRIIGTGEIGLRVAEISKVLHP